ncbi:MAG: hypothetical protein WDN09_02675 [bacterium]
MREGNATSATNAVFIGTNAGGSGFGGAGNAAYSQLYRLRCRRGRYKRQQFQLLRTIRRRAGHELPEHSNIFGDNAGNNATNANNVNFFGNHAGNNASRCQQFPTFFGQNAGATATSASNANFFGQNAGSGASGAKQREFPSVRTLVVAP